MPFIQITIARGHDAVTGVILTGQRRERQG
jgi:hypothetical protein